MSTSTSTKASIAVLGGTGLLGGAISNVLLTEYREAFPTIRVFTRDRTSDKARELAQKGAELADLDVATLQAALAGTDVVVNVLPGGVSAEVRKQINDAAIKSGAKVYFLSEFGLDHRLVHFDGYDHPEWAVKKQLAAEARAAAKATNTKVIALYNGIFLEFTLEPFAGVDLEKNAYTVWGPTDQKFAATSTADIGRAVGRVAQLALAGPATVPDEVRVVGAPHATFGAIRDLVAQVKGVPKGEIRSEDIEALDTRLRELKGTGSFFDYLHVALGRNWVDLPEHDNELVNPGEKFWKWKTLEEHVKGRLAA